MGIIGSKESRIIAKNKVEPGTVMDSRFKVVISIVLLAETYGTDQFDHGVPRRKEVGSLLNSYLFCVTGRVLGQVHKLVSYGLTVNVRLDPVYRPKNT